jgi:transketolase
MTHNSPKRSPRWNVRKEFCAWLESYGKAHEDMLLLTGDLGFQALENVEKSIGKRFVNMGVSEQNLMSVGAALASEGLRPICYSIAPFAVFRPAEQIRLDICIHGLDVKVVGNGGGYGYGIMGSTHHALEDLAMLSSFPNMVCFIPVTGADVPQVANEMMRRKGPSYFRLNMGTLPAGVSLPIDFSPVRRLEGLGGPNSKVTVLALGPLAVNASMAAQQAQVSADVFAVSQFPCADLSADFYESLERTQRLLVAEEHVARGGLGEHLAWHLVRKRLAPKVIFKAAQGYPSKTYGSQNFHQKESGLDAASLQIDLEALTS